MADFLPSDSLERKHIPLATGCFDYFPAALAEVARVSWFGNEKHNPGEPLHHARGKSMDHADAALRHFGQRGGFDEVVVGGVTHRIRHTAEFAWRALAILQEELEAAGAPLARGAKLPEPLPGIFPPKAPLDLVPLNREVNPAAPRPLPAPAPPDKPAVSNTCRLPLSYADGFGCPFPGVCFGNSVKPCPYSRHF
jgi:hypothetical protein